MTTPTTETMGRESPRTVDQATDGIMLPRERHAGRPERDLKGDAEAFSRLLGKAGKQEVKGEAKQAAKGETLVAKPEAARHAKANSVDIPPQARSLGRDSANPKTRAPTAAREAHKPELPDCAELAATQLTVGDRILQGLVQHPTSALAVPAPPAGDQRLSQIETLAGRLAERILVSDRSTPGQSEVRIQLRDTVFEGAEIHLRQEQGGIRITLHAPNAEVARQLSSQGEQLQNALAQRLDTQVRVEVQVRPEAGPVGMRDPGAEGNSGDGRSRNRRDPWEQAEPDNDWTP